MSRRPRRTRILTLQVWIRITNSDSNGYQPKTRSQRKFCRFDFPPIHVVSLERTRGVVSLTQKSVDFETLVLGGLCAKVKDPVVWLSFLFFGITLLPTIAGMLPSFSLQSFAGRSGLQSPSQPGDGSVVSGKSGGGGVLAMVLLDPRPVLVSCVWMLHRWFKGVA